MFIPGAEPCKDTIGGGSLGGAGPLLREIGALKTPEFPSITKQAADTKANVDVGEGACPRKRNSCLGA